MTSESDAIPYDGFSETPVNEEPAKLSTDEEPKTEQD
jgi:hypothetical protein